jgi:hypothetical protein
MKTKASADAQSAAAILGRLGGLARAKKLTPDQRVAIATKASNAACRARYKRSIGILVTKNELTEY